MGYIISHDIGTSSIKSIIADITGNIVASCVGSLDAIYPSPGWVEQNPNDYWQGVCNLTKELMDKTKIDKKEIKGIIFVTQAMGIIPMDAEGEILYNNISWADCRAEKQALSIMKKLGGKRLFTSIIGVPIMGKDVISKLRWLKQERPKIYKRTKFFLDVNGFLKYKCTGKMVGEISGASSYGLNFRTKKHLPIFKYAGIDMKKLPPLINSTDIAGYLTLCAAKELGLNEGVAVFGGCDDVQSMCIGSGMVADNDMHIHLGSSAWVCASYHKRAKFKNNIAVLQSADPKKVLIVGVTESAGFNIDWAITQLFPQERKKMSSEDIYEYVNDIIKDIPAGSNHLISTPWLLGERCPISSTSTRGTIFNINPEHGREHLIKAVYEGVGFNLRWIIEKIEKSYNIECENINIVGGGAESDSWMQIIADIIGKNLKIVDNSKNAGALGGAIIALIGLGKIKDFTCVKTLVKTHKQFQPNGENEDIYKELFIDYKNVYYSLRKAYKVANSHRF